MLIRLATLLAIALVMSGCQNNQSVAGKDEGQIKSENRTPRKRKPRPRTHREKDANTIYREALETAQVEQKNVLICIGESTSREYSLLAKFIQSHSEFFSRDYESICIDTIEMKNSHDLLFELGGNHENLPWIFICDQFGAELITSDCGGRYEFPRRDKEISHFVEMIKQTCEDPDEAHLTAIRKALEHFSKRADENQKRNADIAGFVSSLDDWREKDSEILDQTIPVPTETENSEPPVFVIHRDFEQPATSPEPPSSPVTADDHDQSRHLILDPISQPIPDQAYTRSD